MNKLRKLFVYTLLLLVVLLTTSCNGISILKFKIYFYDGNTVVDVIETSGNEKIELPTVSDKKGYEFMGWYLDNDVKLTEDTYINKTILGDVRANARWNPEVYSIHYFNVDMTNNPITYTILDEFELYDAEKQGHNFFGWYDNKDFLGDPIKRIAAGTTGDIDLYAKFIPLGVITYTVNFETGVLPNPNPLHNVVTLTEAMLPKNVEKTGYCIEGWYLDKDYKEELVLPLNLKEDLTLYCKWVLVEYKITYHNVSEINNPTSYTILDEFPLVNPSSPNQTFEGWYDNPSFEGEPILMIKKGTVGDKDLYARWKDNNPKGYTVNFVTNCEIELAPLSDVSVILENIIPPLTKEGYTLEGWYLDKDFTNKLVYNKPLTSDITLYAKWDLIKYTITYHEGINEENPTTYTILSEFELKAPIKEGYKFLGWYTNSDFSGEPYQRIKKGTTGNLELYAKWEKIQTSE